MRGVIAAIACSLLPTHAAAQNGQATLRANDIIFTAGWAGADHQIDDDRQWRGSSLVSFSAGRYWTDHLKTEIDVGWSAFPKHEVYQIIERQGGYTYALADHRAHDVRVGFTHVYQFGRNGWVHPYLGIGADVVRRHSALDRSDQSRTIFQQNRSVPVTIPAAAERNTTVFAHAVAKGGLKMYVSENAFFNTELKFGIRRDVDHVVWKLGFGVDF